MFKKRTIIIATVFCLAFIITISRLVQLQIVEHSMFRQKREQKRHQLRQVPPRRGTITDRHGRIIAIDKPSYDLWLTPGRVERIDGKQTVVSMLSPLTIPRMLQIARSSGDTRILEMNLARNDLASSNESTKLISALINCPVSEVAAKILASLFRHHPYSEADLTVARPCFKNISIKTYQSVCKDYATSDTHQLFAAFIPRIGTRRVYPAGAAMGHITGYVGQLNEREYRLLRGYWDDGIEHEGEGIISKGGRVFFAIDEEGMEKEIISLRSRRIRGKLRHYAGYFVHETVGRNGIEQYYNQRLRGRHVLRHLRLEMPKGSSGRRLVEVGPPTRAVNGEEIALTIDLRLQRKAREILMSVPARKNIPKEKFRATAILMNPNNGRIIAMVSVPDYDPNTLREQWSSLVRDKRKPLLSSAFSRHFPPGSVIKPIVAAGALQEKKITPQTEFLCNQFIRLKNRDFICFRREAHGDIDATNALMHSCNVFFYHTGKALGSRSLYNWAWNFSLGHRTEIDIAGEVSGTLPDAACTGRQWSLGETYHLAIGQGAIDVTPLQMAVAYAAIANGGKIVTPHVLLPGRSSPKEDFMLDEPRAELTIDPETLKAVRQGMWQVVQGTEERDGTGKRARIKGMDIAGKTGSAEWKKGADTHAWFCCYAPFDNPKIVCVVLVPEGNFGGHTAAPIARKLLMMYFDLPEEGGVG